MAIKSADQITIVDVTDAYSVILSSETYTFVGNTSGAVSGSSCTTQAVAYCGANQCSNVQVIASAISCPEGIVGTTSGSGSSIVTITFTATDTITTACEAIIPVIVDGHITVNKKFSFAVAKQGAAGTPGTPGTNGADAITMSITSSNGTVFKNSSGSTVLTAHVYKAGVEQTVASNGACGSLGTVKWYRSGAADSISTSQTITVSATDVANAVAYTCQLEG